MKKYLSLILFGSLFFGTAMPAVAQMKSESASAPQILAQSDAQASAAQDLITLLAAGNYEEAVEKYDFDQNVTAESLQTDWMDLIDQNGEFQQQLEVVENTSNIVVLRCEFAQKTVNLIILLNDNNKIVSLNTPEAD